jgi:hypothetical protein
MYGFRFVGGLAKSYSLDFLGIQKVSGLIPNIK